MTADIWCQTSFFPRLSYKIKDELRVNCLCFHRRQFTKKNHSHDYLGSFQHTMIKYQFMTLSDMTAKAVVAQCNYLKLLISLSFA